MADIRPVYPSDLRAGECAFCGTKRKGSHKSSHECPEKVAHKEREERRQNKITKWFKPKPKPPQVLPPPPPPVLVDGNVLPPPPAPSESSVPMDLDEESDDGLAVAPHSRKRRRRIDEKESFCECSMHKVSMDKLTQSISSLTDLTSNLCGVVTDLQKQVAHLTKENSKLSKVVPTIVEKVEEASNKYLCDFSSTEFGRCSHLDLETLKTKSLFSASLALAAF